METKFKFSGLNGLGMVDGVLVEIKVSRARVINKDTVMYETDKGVFQNLVLYESREHFEKGIKQTRSVYTTNKVSGKLIEQEGEPIKMELYKMFYGEPITVLEPIALSITRGEWGEIELPEGCYLTRRECLNNETYRYEDEDGNVVEKTGLAKQLRLTDEQTAFVKETLVPAMLKAREMGIEILYDNDDARLKLVNAGNKKFDIGYLSDCMGMTPSTDEYVTSEDLTDIKEMDDIVSINCDNYLTYHKE